MEKFSTFKQDELVFVLRKIYLQTARILETDAIVQARLVRESDTKDFGIFDMILANANTIVDNLLKLMPEVEHSKHPRFKKDELIIQANRFLDSNLY